MSRHGRQRWLAKPKACFVQVAGFLERNDIFDVTRSVDWTPQTAEDVAREEGIALTGKRWCAIASERELLARDGSPPSLVEVAASCGMTVDELNALFPGGAEEVLAHLAGAPEFERNER